MLTSSSYRYGFRKPPHLELKARPKLGEREVTLAHVTDWIEKKLGQELQVHYISLMLLVFRNIEEIHPVNIIRSHS